MASFHHLALRVRDLNESLKLYRDIFGFEQTFGFELDGQIFVHLNMGNAILELVQGAEKPAVPGEQDVFWHGCIGVENVSQTVEILQNAGYEVTLPATELELSNTLSKNESTAVTIAFFKGPDDELIELFQV